MKIDECIEKRYSCRKFKNEAVKDSEIEKILEAGRLAPTAANRQPERIIVLKDKKLIEKMNEATRYMFNANVVFIICYDKNVSWKRRYDDKDYGDVDCALVASNMVLMATSLNIGSCYVASFDEKLAKEILGLGDNMVISLMIPMGYPDEIKEHNTRLDLKDLVIYK